MLLTLLNNLAVTPGFGGDTGARNVGRVVLAPKFQGATLTVPFDFISALSAGETISSASVLAFVYTGVDPTPMAIVNGAATVSGTVVSQSITAGVLGTVYGLKCTANTSLGQVIQLTAFMAIIPDLP